MKKFKLVKDLSEKEYNDLYNLNLGDGGHAKKHVLNAKNNSCPLTEVSLKYDDQELIGWVLLEPIASEELGNYGINFFVKEDRRNKGIGTELFKTVSDYLREINKYGYVVIWSKESQYFYTKNTNERIKVVWVKK